MKGNMLPPIKVVQWVLGGVILIVFGLIAFSNFARSGQAALRTAELRNLQQWGIALNLYLIDNENQLPEVGATPVTVEQTRAWYNVLPPYISETPLAELPEGGRPRPGVPSLWVRPTTKPVKIWDPAVFYFDYAMNSFLQPQAGTRSFRIYEINFPGSVLFLVPVSGYSPGAAPDDVVFDLSEKPPVARVLFCDGHVRAVPRGILKSAESRAVPVSGNGVSWYEK